MSRVGTPSGESPTSELTLVLGGARSGKSNHAERLAQIDHETDLAVTYLATWVPDPDDQAMLARVAAHRVRRPDTWGCLEASGDERVMVLQTLGHTVVLESLGKWLASYEDFVVDPTPLINSLRHRPGHSIVVSEEVGLGVHPSSAVGGQFRDALGSLNQQVAQVADRVLRVVAGQSLVIKG